MAIRAARIWSAFALLAMLLSWSPALAVEARAIATTPDSDYFGFDLRSVQNVTLDQCKSTCLGDSACRAFTYNPKAKWCFLKSDFSHLNPFPGAVAGKVVLRDSAPDIGAPPALSFFAANMVDEARRFHASLTNGSVAVGEEGLAALTDTGREAMRNGDPHTAMQKFTSAVATAPDDGALWIELSRAILGTAPANEEEAVRLQRDGTSAAWNGYQLSRSAAARAEALAVLAAGLDKRELYRPALQAYEASLALENSAYVRAEYEDLKARKGFRIVDHSVDSDAATPRICAQFSEDLVRTGVDYTSFVKLDDATPKAIEAKDKQICVEGLEHGRHYRVTFRAGLPAAVGEALAAPVTLSIYVKDRSPSVRFTGDSFVLPATARRGIPLVSVNTAVADVKLFRIGDRSLAQLLSGYQFLRQLDGYDISSVSDQMGEPIWEGQIETAGNELNKEVTTSFPIDEALPNRRPGVYVLTAQPQNDRSESYEARATQWFVVSDIGLSTYTGQDGLNVFARSLGTAQPLSGVELTLLARNNEVLGKATTDAAGRATFTPGLTRGTGGMVPAVLMASQGDSDFVFLDMTRAGFDLSDRGVAGRAAPAALDVYAWTERGIYRVG